VADVATAHQIKFKDQLTNCAIPQTLNNRQHNDNLGPQNAIVDQIQVLDTNLQNLELLAGPNMLAAFT
jgi:hypothetical protein